MRSSFIAAFGVFALVTAVAADDPFAPSMRSLEVVQRLPLEKASVGGKYRRLLRAIECPMDKANYGDFHEYGHYTGAEWHHHKNLPAGYWVWVAPKWYIWGDAVK